MTVIIYIQYNTSYTLTDTYLNSHFHKKRYFVLSCDFPYILFVSDFICNLVAFGRMFSDLFFLYPLVPPTTKYNVCKPVIVVNVSELLLQ